MKEPLFSDPMNIPLDTKYMEAIEYSEINEIIDSERKHSIDWLKNAIETPKEQMPGIILPDTVKKDVP